MMQKFFTYFVMYSGSISLDELKELMLEDSVLISKQKETVSPSDLLRRTQSKKMTFHKLSESSSGRARSAQNGGFSDIENAFQAVDENESSKRISSKNPGAIVPVTNEDDDV